MLKLKVCIFSAFLNVFIRCQTAEAALAPSAGAFLHLIIKATPRNFLKGERHLHDSIEINILHGDRYDLCHTVEYYSQRNNISMETSRRRLSSSSRPSKRQFVELQACSQ
ncbi:hypothetical protein NL108_009965 [Boleophthalmus pectinirostris]|nr:hypothetical protein NL108_009965 [Boleophthalmus pectinirostris]